MQSDKKKSRDDDIFNFKSEVDIGLKSQIEDIISLLDSDTDFDALDIVLAETSSPKIEGLLQNDNLPTEKESKTEKKQRKRRVLESPPLKAVPKRRKTDTSSKTRKPSMWDEIVLSDVSSVITRKCVVNIVRLSPSINKLLQSYPLSSLKGAAKGKRKRRSSIEVQQPEKKRQKLDFKEKAVSKKPKKTKSQMLDDESWNAKPSKPKSNRKPSKKITEKSNDYEEFVEYRGPKLISELSCTDEDNSSSDEEISHNQTRRYAIRVEETPPSIKSILSPRENSTKTRKRIKFCSTVFIRNFMSSKDS